MTYYLYVLKCADNSLYTGITTDLARRVHEHNTSPKGSRYTRARRPVVLVYSREFEDRRAVSIAEASFKKLKRQDKLTLIGYNRENE